MEYTVVAAMVSSQVNKVDFMVSRSLKYKQVAQATRLASVPTAVGYL
jgi:hypothetical protein